MHARLGAGIVDTENVLSTVSSVSVHVRAGATQFGELLFDRLAFVL